MLLLALVVHPILEVTGLLAFSRSVQDLYTIRTMQGVSITTCKLECESRQRCKSAIFYRHADYCILTSQDALNKTSVVSKGAVLLSGFHSSAEPSYCGAQICSPRHTCTTKLQGDSTIKVCEITECLNPRTILPNGTKIKGNIFTVGSKLLVECDQIMTTIQCGSDGKWTKMEPNCPTPTVQNGVVKLNILGVCSRAMAVCDDGFHLASSVPFMVCLSGGSWSHVPVCEPEILTTQPLRCTIEYALVSGANGVDDAQMTASSEYDNNYQAHHAKFSYSTAWATTSIDLNPYWKVTFLTSRIVTGITTQGHYIWWVKTYMIQGSNDPQCLNFDTQLDESGNQDFPGNTDVNTNVTHHLQSAVNLRCVLVWPLSWQDWAVMRIELLGCD